MVLSLPDLWWARQQGPGPASPISMESGTGARWRALVSFIPLAAESESMPFGLREFYLPWTLTLRRFNKS